MEFIKYPKIENYYQQKVITEALEQWPDLETATYIISHKIDGSNFQIITDGVDVRFASRNQLRGATGSFQRVDLTKFYERHSKLIDLLKIISREHNQPVNCFGELFGASIQRRINYGKEWQYRVFDIAIGGKFINLYVDAPLPLCYVVDYFPVVHGLEAALNYNINHSSELIQNDDLIEGVIIRDIDNRLVLKKKSESFNEKIKQKKKLGGRFSDEIEKLRSEFVSLINENRVKSIFSQNGEIEYPQQIPEYIKLVLDDAKSDFKYDVSDCEPKEKKYIYNVGSNIVNILKSYL